MVGNQNLTKNIKLTIENCYCRPIDLSEDRDDGFYGINNSGSGSGGDSVDIDDCVFELSLKDGSQRLWLASNKRERDAWVRSINTAMIGSAGDFSLDDRDPTGTIFVPQSPMMDTAKEGSH